MIKETLGSNQTKQRSKPFLYPGGRKQPWRSRSSSEERAPASPRRAWPPQSWPRGASAAPRWTTRGRSPHYWRTFSSTASESDRCPSPPN